MFQVECSDGSVSTGLTDALERSMVVLIFSDMVLDSLVHVE